MDHKDEIFFTALAYAAVTEKNLDILAFRQKVEENRKILTDQRPNKAHIGDRSKLGI